MTQRRSPADKLYDDEEVAPSSACRPPTPSTALARTRGYAPPYVRLTYRRNQPLAQPCSAWLKDPLNTRARRPNWRPSRTSTRAGAKPFSAYEARLARVRARKSGQAAADDGRSKPATR